MYLNQFFSYSLKKIKYNKDMGYLGWLGWEV